VVQSDAVGVTSKDTIEQDAPRERSTPWIIQIPTKVESILLNKKERKSQLKTEPAHTVVGRIITGEDARF
tara:strand:+ start:3636 stop:3845 length:210 start_codon:yes stop_codon:yes gene_type:complete